VSQLRIHRIERSGLLTRIAHRGRRKAFVAHADEKLTAFEELESAIFA